MGFFGYRARRHNRCDASTNNERRDIFRMPCMHDTATLNLDCTHLTQHSSQIFINKFIFHWQTLFSLFVRYFSLPFSRKIIVIIAALFTLSILATLVVLQIIEIAFIYIFIRRTLRNTINSGVKHGIFMHRNDCRRFPFQLFFCSHEKKIIKNIGIPLKQSQSTRKWMGRD